MLNLQTILSTFDCKGTLLKWLKLLEAAIKEGVLESVEIKKIDDSNAQLILNFADGTQSVSNSFELPQGPKGDTGATGPQGPKGDTAEVTVQQLHSLIEGSPTVIADINEAGTAINIHLDNAYKTKIDNSLQAPTTAPVTTELVGIGDNKAQQRIGQSGTIKIENNKVVAGLARYTISVQSIFTWTDPVSTDNIDVSVKGYFDITATAGLGSIADILNDYYTNTGSYNVVPFVGGFTVNTGNGNALQSILAFAFGEGIAYIHALYLQDAQLIIDEEMITDISEGFAVVCSTSEAWT